MFNNWKFECLKSGCDQELKDQYNYITPDMNFIITVKDNIKDLGVWMSSNGNFDFHIKNVISKVKQGIGWIRRSFMTNNPHIRKFM